MNPALQNLKDAINGITDSEFTSLTDYSKMAVWLNAPTRIDNPEPQGSIPSPLGLQDLLTGLTDGETSKVLQIGIFVQWASSKLSDPLITEQQTKDDLRYVSGVLAQGNVTGQENFLATMQALLELPVRVPAQKMIDALKGASVLSSATHAKLRNKLTATISDPSYQPKIAGPSIAEQNNLGVVTAAQIQEVMN